MSLIKLQLKGKLGEFTSNATTEIAKAAAMLMATVNAPKMRAAIDQAANDAVAQEEENVLVFYCTKDYLMSEAHKRTSYIGRVRRNEEKSSLMEQVTFTADDEDLADSFLRESQGYVFEKLQNYTHGLENCCVFDTVTYTENDTEHNAPMFLYKINHMEWFNDNATMMLDTAISEAMIAFLMFKWFLGALPSEAQFYYEEFERQLKNITQRVNTQKQPVRRKYHLF